MKPTLAVLTGDGLAAALVDAIKSYRAHYVPHHPFEGLIGGPVRSLKVQSTLWRPGHFEVHVHVEGFGQLRDADYWYTVTLSAGELKLERWGD